VFLFSSGPLDASADKRDIAPTNQVSVVMERLGALGHRTFGGMLAPDAAGFPASAMAKEHAGDWRNPEAIRAWAQELAELLPRAVHGDPVDHQAAAWPHVALYAGAGWLATLLLAALVFALLGPVGAVVALALAAPVLFVLVPAWVLVAATLALGRTHHLSLPRAGLAVLVGLIPGALIAVTFIR
jgi:hypothetical protein